MRRVSLALAVVGVAAKYSSAQIYNPVGSGKTLVVNALAGYNSVGTVTWSVIPSTFGALGVDGGGTKLNNKAGGASATLQLRYANLDTLTANPPYTISVTATTFAGTALRPDGSVLFTIPEGYGINFEQNTTTLGLNLFAEIAEI